MVRLSWQDWVYLALAVVVVNWIAERLYVILGRYRNFQSPWKRLAVVGILPLMTLGLLIEVWYVTTH